MNFPVVKNSETKNYHNGVRNIRSVKTDKVKYETLWGTYDNEFSFIKHDYNSDTYVDDIKIPKKAQTFFSKSNPAVILSAIIALLVIIIVGTLLAIALLDSLMVKVIIGVALLVIFFVLALPLALLREEIVETRKNITTIHTGFFKNMDALESSAKDIATYIKKLNNKDFMYLVDQFAEYKDLMVKRDKADSVLQATSSNNIMHQDLEEKLNEINEQLSNKMKYFDKISEQIIKDNLDTEILNVIVK